MRHIFIELCPFEMIWILFESLLKLHRYKNLIFIASYFGFPCFSSGEIIVVHSISNHLFPGNIPEIIIEETVKFGHLFVYYIEEIVGLGLTNQLLDLPYFCVVEKNIYGAVICVPFAPDFSSYGVSLAVENGLGLFLVHQLAVFIGEKRAVQSDLKLFDVAILLGCIDMATLDIVGKENRLGIDLFEKPLENLNLAPSAVAINWT